MSAKSVMRYNDKFYCVAWGILEGIFESLQVIIVAKLESIHQASQVKVHDSGRFNFIVLISNVASDINEKKTDYLLMCNEIETFIGSR